MEIRSISKNHPLCRPYALRILRVADKSLFIWRASGVLAIWHAEIFSPSRVSGAMGDCSSSLPVNIVNPQTRHSCTATLSEELEKRLPGIVIENVGMAKKS
ncbi:hypothetical protein BJV77DRAFT_1034677 [Russula vinacea]|nr:hypothetical protein BJV77DRAFT_1034677 [Russula vinacea]